MDLDGASDYPPERAPDQQVDEMCLPSYWVTGR